MNPVPKRVVLVGAESSGKTTLAKALAESFHTWWVPEYYRYYWEAKHLGLTEPIWTTAEFVHIAKMQNQIEDHYATMANQVLIIDTDSLMTAVWHDRYLSLESPDISRLWLGRQRDLVLFCQTDIAFVQDGTRDGESIRPLMSQWIEERLERHKIKFEKISGSADDRFHRARQLILELLS